MFKKILYICTVASLAAFTCHADDSRDDDVILFSSEEQDDDALLASSEDDQDDALYQSSEDEDDFLAACGCGQTKEDEEPSQSSEDEGELLASSEDDEDADDFLA